MLTLPQTQELVHLRVIVAETGAIAPVVQACHSLPTQPSCLLLCPCSEKSAEEGLDLLLGSWERDIYLFSLQGGRFHRIHQVSTGDRPCDLGLRSGLVFFQGSGGHSQVTNLIFPAELGGRENHHIADSIRRVSHLLLVGLRNGALITVLWSDFKQGECLSLKLNWIPWGL